MSEEDLPFLHSVIAEFARSEWTDHQLDIAAMLARAMAVLERVQYELRGEGSVMTSEHAKPMVHPRQTVGDMTTETLLSTPPRSSLTAPPQHREAQQPGHHCA